MCVCVCVCVCVIRISGKVDNESTYNVFSGNILFFYLQNFIRGNIAFSYILAIEENINKWRM